MPFWVPSPRRLHRASSVGQGSGFRGRFRGRFRTGAARERRASSCFGCRAPVLKTDSGRPLLYHLVSKTYFVSIACAASSFACVPASPIRTEARLLSAEPPPLVALADPRLIGRVGDYEAEGAVGAGLRVALKIALVPTVAYARDRHRLQRRCSPPARSRRKLVCR